MIAQKPPPSGKFTHTSELDMEDLIAAGVSDHNRFGMTDLWFVSVSTVDSAAIIASLDKAGGRVLALGTIAQKEQRLAAFAAGAREFLTTTPIDPAQLAGRLEFLATGKALPDDVAIDPVDGTLTLDGANHALSPREQKLIGMLIEAGGGLVTHDALLAQVWEGRYSDRQHLRVAINRLRRRIEPEPGLPRYLLSEPAIGYRLGTGRVIPPIDHM